MRKVFLDTGCLIALGSVLFDPLSDVHSSPESSALLGAGSIPQSAGPGEALRERSAAGSFF